MANYFTGKKEVTRFTVELNKGKAVIECIVWEYWKPLVNDTVKCGAQVTHNLKRTTGIKAIEKASLENSLHASIGVKDLAEIKAVAKDHLSNEISWETITEETRSITFVAPKCGRYLASQYQKLREYLFRFQEKKWFHKNSWQSPPFTEYTTFYHDDSKQIDFDPDCHCKTPDPGDYDGLLHVDFGETSMLVPFRKTDTGIEAIFAGKTVQLSAPSGDPENLTVPKDFIPESLRFLGSMAEESYEAVASLYSEAEIEVPAVEVTATY